MTSYLPNRPWGGGAGEEEEAGGRGVGAILEARQVWLPKRRFRCLLEQPFGAKEVAFGARFAICAVNF